MSAARAASAIFSVISRRKLALSAEAALGDNGGTRRVLTRPGRGAFAITAIAQPPLGDIGAFITTHRRRSSPVRYPAQRPARGCAHAAMAAQRIIGGAWGGADPALSLSRARP